MLAKPDQPPDRRAVPVIERRRHEGAVVMDGYVKAAHLARPNHLDLMEGDDLHGWGRGAGRGDRQHRRRTHDDNGETAGHETHGASFATTVTRDCSDHTQLLRITPSNATSRAPGQI